MLLENSRRPARPKSISLLVSALLLAILSSALISVAAPTEVFGTTTTKAAACGVNVRTSASTSGAIRTSIKSGTKVSVTATVSGGTWRATCAGKTVSGSKWYRISAINGRSVKSLYGVTYLYAATGLFKAVSTVTTASTTTITTKAAACGVNVRTSASTSGAIRTSIKSGTKVSVTATVSGGTWRATCAGKTVSGSKWYRISAINGRSVKSLYGVTYLYAATGLFKAVSTVTPTPIPTPMPTPAPTAAPTPPAAATAIRFYGRGTDHGIGLSQYGARGRALTGQTAEEIVAAYYRGTTIGRTDPAQTVRVLLVSGFTPAAGQSARLVGKGGPWSIDGIPGTYPAGSSLEISRGSNGWLLRVRSATGSVLLDAPAPSSLRIRPGSTATRLQVVFKPSYYDTYRGVIRVIIGSAGLSVVNEVGLDDYLRGVVPAEMPASWPAAALRAQALVARSYAVAHLRPGVGTFDVYDTTASQVYLGALYEMASTTAAIAATSGTVVMAGKTVANTLFHSTAGGATENNENVYLSWDGRRLATPVSYLRGVSDRAPDGTSYDAASPWATWQTKSYSLAALSAIFAKDPKTDVGIIRSIDLSRRGTSGRLLTVRLVGSSGTKTVSGDYFKDVFNVYSPASDPALRSTLFDIAPPS